jgi:hypothetical protein
MKKHTNRLARHAVITPRKRPREKNRERCAALTHQTLSGRRMRAQRHHAGRQSPTHVIEGRRQFPWFISGSGRACNICNADRRGGRSGAPSRRGMPDSIVPAWPSCISSFAIRPKGNRNKAASHRACRLDGPRVCLGFAPGRGAAGQPPIFEPVSGQVGLRFLGKVISGCRDRTAITSVETECENPETKSTLREGANTWVFGAAPGKSPPCGD